MNNNNSKMNNNLSNKVNNSKTKYVYVQQPGSLGSSVFGIILLLVVILIIISSSYWLYNYYNKQSFIKIQEVDVMPDVKNANSKFNVSSGSIPNSSYSNEYSISSWINIQDYNYNYGKEKIIMRRGTEGNSNLEIVLGAKSNDLIVRLKLQGQDNTVSSFTDIPITFQRENFNITSSPAPVQFEIENNIQNNVSSVNNISDVNIYKNDEIHMFNKNSNMGDNTVDFPTIQYVSNNNIYNNKYFSMISGNDIDTMKTDAMTTNTQNNTISEGFDNVSDATTSIINILVDICNITSYFQNSTTADNAVDIINMFFSIIIEYIENLKQSIKNQTMNTTNLDIITTNFKSKLSNLTVMNSNNNLATMFDKLNTDIIILKKYENVQIEYNILKNAINMKMKEINCPLTFDGMTEIDGNLSFLENFIKLLQMTLQAFLTNLSKSINHNTQNTSCNIDTNISSDPTIGTCIVKMIPLQKWVHVIVSVYNQVIDIYIDGQLSSSCVLKRFPDISTTDVDITPDGGFSGMISRVKFMNSAMTIQQAKSIYHDGPIYSESLLSIIPTWVYWGLIIIILLAITYSFL